MNKFLTLFADVEIIKNKNVEKHGTHDQSTHAGARRRTGGEVQPSDKKPQPAQGEQEVTDPNAPKPKLKPGRKPDASGSVEERMEKLVNGERVEVTSDEIREVIDIMSKRKDNPDMTNMHIKNTELYDEDNLGIPRNKMPQVPSDAKKEFVFAMERRGAKATRGVADPKKLHPIQAEISASKSAQIALSLEKQGIGSSDESRIIISKDNYVIDGHHRWAAVSLMSFSSPTVRLPVIKIDMNHKDLIDATLAWNQATGIQSIGMGENNPRGQLQKWAEFDAIVAKAVRKRTVVKFQPGLRPVIKHLPGGHKQKTHGSWAGYRSETAAEDFGPERAKELKGFEKTGPTYQEISDVIDGFAGRALEEVVSREELRLYAENENRWYQEAKEIALYSSSDFEDFLTQQEDLVLALADREKWFRDFEIQNPPKASQAIDDVFDSMLEDNIDEIANEYFDAMGIESRSQNGLIQSFDLSNDFIGKLQEVYRFDKDVELPDGGLDTIGSYVNAVYREGNSIQVTGDIQNASGEFLGEFRRTISKDDKGKLVVEHDLLAIENRDYQRNGFGTDFHMSQENYYMTHNFDRIEVHASLDVGGYMWAKMGFQWDENATGKTDVGYRLQALLEESNYSEAQIKLEPQTKTILKDWETRLFDNNSKNDPEPFELAAIRDPNFPNNRQVGKELMLNSNWYGVKYLTPTGRRDNVAQSDLTQENSYASWRVNDKVIVNLGNGEIKGQLKLPKED
jgi:hypothetical protein